jgi:hypothetical protein
MWKKEKKTKEETRKKEMIDSIVVTWNPISEKYFITIMELGVKHPVETYNAFSIEEVLDILHLKVKDETKR